MEKLREGISTSEYLRIVNENFGDIAAIQGVAFDSFTTITSVMTQIEVNAAINSNFDESVVSVGQKGGVYKNAIFNKAYSKLEDTLVIDGPVKYRNDVQKTAKVFTTLSRGVNIFLGYGYLYGEAPYYLSFKIGDKINSLLFADSGLISNGIGFANGNAIICMRDNTVWKSDDQMESLTEIALKDTDDTDYVFASGNSYYFRNPYGGFVHGFVDDKEVAVMGNYTQLEGALNPINVYYSVDGIGLKVALKLEDTVRHVHSAKYNSANQKFYIFTGDGGVQNCWYEGTYDTVADSWNWDQLITEANQLNYERYRLIGLEFIGDYVVWGSDSGTEPGIFKVLFSEINIPANHRLVKEVDANVYSSCSNGNNVYMTYTGNQTVSYSSDAGETWVDIDISIVDLTAAFRDSLDVDENGYVLLKNRTDSIGILIKPV